MMVVLIVLDMQREEFEDDVALHNRNMPCSFYDQAFVDGRN